MGSATNDDLKVTLLQPGARHNYALIRHLHHADCLQRLYTDFALADSFVSRAATSLLPSRFRDKARRRIAREIPAAKIRRLPEVRKQNRVGRPEPWRIDAVDLKATDIFYAQYYSGGHGLRERIRPDAKIVSDVFTLPSTHKIVNEECRRFPLWGESPFPPELSERYEVFTHDMLEDSDALFCPAPAVLEDVCSYDPSYRSKCVLVPYGSSLRVTDEVDPVEQRVLFAGTITVRKGPQYVKAAADRLLREAPGMRFVFAGSCSQAARTQLEGDNIEVLGHLSKLQMAEEFSKADVFVLPSLAEGSAGVVLEAMAAGVPVVVTRSAGVDFADGGPGYIVLERDVDALVDRIRTITGDRELRQAMSRAAKARSQEYDFQAWREHFVGSLRSLPRLRPELRH